MIAKITKGKRAAGAIRYDFGPGRRDEHERPRVIAGSVPGTPRQIARIIDHHTRPSGLTSPIWRCSLSLPDEDGILADATFAEIATAYVERMGYGGCPWVAVRHGDDHIHLTVSRVGWDRRTVPDRGDFIRSMPIVRALEREHGLIDASARSDRIAPQVSGQERAASQRRGATEPERLQIRAAVWAARDAAAGRGRAVFEQLLTDAGVEYRANVASTGRMNGYSFSLPSWTDAEGAQVWVTASKTAKDLAWQKLRPVLDPPGTEQPAVAEAAPLLTVDLARQRLAEAKQRADRLRADVAQALAAIPAGTVVDVAAALRTTRSTLATRGRTLAAETSTAMKLDGIASGVSAGPARVALHRRRAELAAAVAAEAEAAGHAGAAAQQRQQAAAARRVEEESRAKAAKRWRLPKGRADAEGMAAAAADLAAHADAEAARLERLAEASLRRAAEAAPADVSGPYDRALAELEQGWHALDQAVTRQDQQNARVQQADHAAPLQAARVAVAQARRGVEQLLAEQARRAALPADRAALEDQVRADLAREATARAARTGSTTARPTKKAAPKKKAGPAASQPPPHLRRGTDPRGRGKPPSR